MLRNVLGLHKVRVDDVMIPRADIVAVSNETSLGDLLKLFRSAGHSRLPVYGETLDDPRAWSTSATSWTSWLPRPSPPRAGPPPPGW